MDIRVMDGKPIIDEARRFNEGGDTFLLNRIVDHFGACFGDRWDAAFRPYVGEAAHEVFRNTVRKCISTRIQGDRVVEYVVLALLCRLKGLKWAHTERELDMDQYLQDGGDVVAIPPCLGEPGPGA
jgi:hypothetical protein